MLRLRFLLCSILVLLVGCGSTSDAPDRRIVSGTVTLNGAPLEGATIRFIPEPEGPIATGKIIDGKYEVDNKGGVPVGSHRVEIEGTPIFPVDTEGISLEEIKAKTKPAISIPQKYNTNSELRSMVDAGNKPLIVNFELTN